MITAQCSSFNKHSFNTSENGTLESTTLQSLKHKYLKQYKQSSVLEIQLMHHTQLQSQVRPDSVHHNKCIWSNQSASSSQLHSGKFQEYKKTQVNPSDHFQDKAGTLSDLSDRHCLKQQ